MSSEGRQDLRLVHRGRWRGAVHPLLQRRRRRLPISRGRVRVRATRRREAWLLGWLATGTHTRLGSLEAEWCEGAVCLGSPGGVRMVKTGALGALVGPLDVPITEENDAEGVKGCPSAPPSEDSVVSHVWVEHPRRRASHGREAGLTWSAIAIETNMGVRSRLDHATLSDAPCHMARRASSPSPRNRFRPRRP